MFTQRHYVMVAGVINKQFHKMLGFKYDNDQDDYRRGLNAGYAQALRDLQSELSEEFYGDNPNFSPSKFKAACFRTDK